MSGLRCRACKSYISDMKPSTQAPICPHCGVFYLDGWVPLWAVGLIVVGYVAWFTVSGG